MRKPRIPRLNFHCPLKVKIKRNYYRAVLIAVAGGVWVAHEMAPQHEMLVAFVTNLLFALDPTSGDPA